MRKYYNSKPERHKPGHPPLTLAALLDKDLSTIPRLPNQPKLRLTNKLYYNEYQAMAQNRQEWKEFTEIIIMNHNRIQDNKRQPSEQRRGVPTSNQLSAHYSIDDRHNNPQDLSTPPGMDYRNNKRSPSYTLPRRTKAQRRLEFTQNNEDMAMAIE
jgi:hypothetical protein